MCVLISLALRLALALLAHLQLEAQTGDGEKSREIINQTYIDCTGGNGLSFLSLLIMLEKIIYNQTGFIPQCQLFTIHSNRLKVSV